MKTFFRLVTPATSLRALISRGKPPCSSLICSWQTRHSLKTMSSLFIRTLFNEFAVHDALCVKPNDFSPLLWSLWFLTICQNGFSFVLIHKVNRCLARYSLRATTTNRPTNRAPNKPAWPGPNWPKMPILGQIWSFLGKNPFFYLRNHKFCYPHNRKPT